MFAFVDIYHSLVRLVIFFNLIFMVYLIFFQFTNEYILIFFPKIVDTQVVSYEFDEHDWAHIAHQGINLSIDKLFFFSF